MLDPRIAYQVALCLVELGAAVAGTYIALQAGQKRHLIWLAPLLYRAVLGLIHILRSFGGPPIVMWIPAGAMPLLWLIGHLGLFCGFVGLLLIFSRRRPALQAASLEPDR